MADPGFSPGVWWGGGGCQPDTVKTKNQDPWQGSGRGASVTGFGYPQKKINREGVVFLSYDQDWCNLTNMNIEKVFFKFLGGWVGIFSLICFI